MKAISLILLILSLINISFSKDSKAPKNSIKAQRYSHIICNQKNIPMKVEQSLNASILTVTFTANQKIENFSVKNVRGIDGVTISKFQELLDQKLQSGEAREVSVELSDFKGLVYVVFDVSIKVNGISANHSIPVAVGTLSENQKVARSKNIKEIKNNSEQKDSSNRMTAPTKKIHEMKLE